MLDRKSEPGKHIGCHILTTTSMTYNERHLDDSQSIVNNFADFFSSAYIVSTEVGPKNSLFTNNNLFHIKNVT